MKFYLYDEKTKEYTGTQNAFIDPLETKAQGKNVYLVPPFSTTEKPNLTILKDNEILVFKGDKWQVEQEFYVGKIVDCHGERVSKYVTDNDLTFEKCDEGFKIVEKPVPKEKSLEQLQLDRYHLIDRQIEEYLDAKVKEHNYKSVESCVSYYNSTDDKYRAEARAVSTWRDHIYHTGEQVWQSVLDGTVNYEDVDLQYIIGISGDFTWPEVE